MKEFLNTLLRSLDNLEIKGRENMDILLGCMMAIEQQIASLEAEEVNETEAENGR